MNQVNSTSISEVGYDESNQDLHIVFKRDQRHYIYKSVPATEFTALMEAESIGNHVSTVIRPTYDFVKVS